MRADPPLETRIIVRPRAAFRPYLERDQRWSCIVAHRRAGKTMACVQDLILKANTLHRQGPPMRFGYVAPTRDQGKDICWAYFKSFTSKIPRVTINEADLKVTLPNEATLRLYSGENYERMRGLYFDGVVIDEPADIDPAAWHTVIRPCLSDYQGWATFIGTPKGRNQFWKMWTTVQNNPDWFTLILKASESGLLPDKELADIRAGSPSHVYEQEYECSFAVARLGAIYAKQIEDARNTKRITVYVEWFKELPVYTAFDVGAPVNQKCWVFQQVGDRLNFLEAMSGGDDCKTPADWAARLRVKQYSYGAHFLPHDACSENGGLWQDGLLKAGLTHIVPVPRQISVWDGINLGVDAFPRIHINESGCADGIEAMDAYHSKEERDGATVKDVPVHDWSSHYSDAFSLAHQAINKGLVIDRSAIAKKPRNRGMGKVVGGFRG